MFAPSCKCRVGMFDVNKKSDEQRLALDARYASCHFAEPPKVHLASWQSFATIEVEPGQQIWIGNVDIQVAFYAMEFPQDLMTDFGLPHGVRAGDVRVIAIDGSEIHLGQKVYPVLAAVPMGWTHSSAVC